MTVQGNPYHRIHADVYPPALRIGKAAYPFQISVFPGGFPLDIVLFRHTESLFHQNVSIREWD